MEGKSVVVFVRGEQRLDAETEENTMRCTGILARRAEGWRLHYEETGADTAGVETDVLVEDGRVALIRRGTVRSRMVFEKGMTHEAFYALGGGSLTMDVQTDSVRIALGEDGGEIECCYRIGTNGAEISENRLLIQAVVEA